MTNVHKIDVKKELKILIIQTLGYYGQEVSDDVLRMYAEDLADLPLDAVRTALMVLRRDPKVTRFPLPGVIRAKIVEQDGRPGVNEAWALVPLDESTSVVMNDEIAAAYEVARPLLMDGAKTQAFFAFKERYEADVAAARLAGKPTRWWPSLGHSVAGRKAALLEAVSKGRLALEDAKRVLPELEFKPVPRTALPDLTKLLKDIPPPEDTL